MYTSSNASLESNLDKQAMVAVFLCALKCSRGIIFVTANRILGFDDAT
jgi:hypothetical protein